MIHRTIFLVRQWAFYLGKKVIHLRMFRAASRTSLTPACTMGGELLHCCIMDRGEVVRLSPAQQQHPHSSLSFCLNNLSI